MLSLHFQIIYPTVISPSVSKAIFWYMVTDNMFVACMICVVYDTLHITNAKICTSYIAIGFKEKNLQQLKTRISD